MGNTLSRRDVRVAVRDLASSNESQQQQAARRVANWACKDAEVLGNCQDIFPGLVQLLGSSNINVQEQAARALMNLASCDANQQKIGECEGAIHGLVQLLGSEAVQDSAAGALLDLTEQDAFDLLCCSRREDVQRAAAGALSNLAYQNDFNQKLIGECKGAIPGLVQLLGSSWTAVQEVAARAVSNLAYQNDLNKELIGECEGAIPGLVQLVRSSSEAVQVHAARALRFLAMQSDLNRKLIGECEGAIPGLVQLLRSNREAVQQQAAGALHSLTVQNDLNSKLIGECEGAIPGLVRLLGSSSEAVQTYAAAALGSLAYPNDLNRKLIGECKDAIPGLVQLLGSSSEAVQQCAALALSSLTVNDFNRKLIGECKGAIPGLVQLLTSNSEAVQEQAAAALGNLAYLNDLNQKLIVECKGAIPGFVQLLGSSSEALQECAAAALRSLAYQNDLNKKLIGECKDAIPGLVQLLKSSSEAVQEHAAGALRNLATYAPNQKLIGECKGAIPGLVQLLGSSREAIREDAAYALRYLASYAPNHKLISGCDGAVPGLVQLLGSSSEHLKSHAAAALRNLAAACPPNQKLIHEAIDSVYKYDIPTPVCCLVEDICSVRGQSEASSPTTNESLCNQNLTGMGVAALQATANLGQLIPMCGPIIAGALKTAASVLSMVQQMGLNKAKASILAQRVQLIHGELQDLQTKAVNTRVQISKSEEESILMALQQLKTAFDAASQLLTRWRVSADKKKIWQAVQRFCASQQDRDDLIEVDQQLCTSYNQLANVLSTCSLCRLQQSASRAEAAIAACQQDIASFEQNLIQLAGDVAQVQNELQQHRQEMQHVFPLLQAMGVQLRQLDSLVSKMDFLAAGMSGLDQGVQEIVNFVRQQQQQQQQQHKVLAPKPGMLILPGSLKLGGILGEGGFGAVHIAKYGREDVAVKVFFLQRATDEDMRQVYREAILLSRLQHHPNIIRCYGLVADPSQDANSSKSPLINGTIAAAPNLHGSLVMEKCDRDLRKLLQADTIQLGLLDKVFIGLDVASGMCYLHHDCGDLAPVIHGDLKPSNVLVNLGPDGKPWQVKVCDFGISRTCQVSSTLYITTTGKFRSPGSLQWMAPEVCRHLVDNKKGSKQSNAKEVDVYAFGILMFEVVTRQLPYDGENIAMLPMRVGYYDFRPDIEEWLQQQGVNNIELGVLQQLVALVKSCWAADPSVRPSFRDIVGQLQGMAEQLAAQV